LLWLLLLLCGLADSIRSVNVLPGPFRQEFRECVVTMFLRLAIARYRAALDRKCAASAISGLASATFPHPGLIYIFPC
jgi:hypothetical protein